jgi:hypothetical protein
LEALLTKVRVAVAVPLVCGVNVTLYGRLCPTESTAGRDSPLMVNSGLVLVADETVTAAPVALRDELRVELVPTTTSPKLRRAGETPSWPGAVPVPDEAMTSGELPAFETRVRFAVMEVAVPGAKVTLNVTLCPADKSVGSVSPLIE